MKTYTQCNFCKADSERFPYVSFNKPELMGEVDGTKHYSSLGCSNCRNYAEAKTVRT